MMVSLNIASRPRQQGVPGQVIRSDDVHGSEADEGYNVDLSY